MINNSYFELKRGKYFDLKKHLCNLSSRDIHFAETCLTITSSLARLARQDAGIRNRNDAARKIRSIFRTGLLAGQDLCSIYGCPANPTVSSVGPSRIIPALRETNLESTLALDSNVDVLRAVQDWQPLVSALLSSVSNFTGIWLQRYYNEIDNP